MLTVKTDAGVMPSRDPGKIAFAFCPGEHRTEFHSPVASGAGKRSNARLIALNQSLNDLADERVTRIHDMVRDAELLTDSCSVYQTFSATCPLPTHQPEG
jgi:hypothetical protein